MVKTYMYKVVGNDMYKVMRYDDGKDKGERFTEYLINLKDGRTLCSCKGFYYTKRSCKHIKFLLSQLMDKGGIIRFEKEGDYDRIMEVKK